MDTRLLRRTIAAFAFAVLTATAPVRLLAQSQEQANGNAHLAAIQGYVCDPRGKPVPDASVSLLTAAASSLPGVPTQVVHTNADGAYRFTGVRAGSYFLRAEINTYGQRVVGPVTLTANETKKIDLVLASPPSAKNDDSQNTSNGLPPAKENPKGPDFYDEPQFTVAGVTQATSAGGHGSDTVLRTTEALARATASLDKEPGKTERGADASTLASTEISLQAALSRNPKDPALHHKLGDVEEKLGHPLQAVREYQRAAELDPGELYLYDWGTELLKHRALEPATEVLTKGNRLFPQSVRMLVALGVAWYARGSNELAARLLAHASDLDPADPSPYLFLGKMQSAEISPLEGSIEKLARFAQLQPENSLANYYYALALLRQLATTVDAERDKNSERAEALLQKAVRLDPNFGAAYLQLGILYSRREDFAQAISAYEKAIAVSPEPSGPQKADPQLASSLGGDPQLVVSQLFDAQTNDTLEEAHYRLAQAYLRSGNKTKAQEQLQLHDQLAKKTKADADRKRRDILDFVISLRDGEAGPLPHN